jgi:U4/U6.U5 tri-snRNP component SNU23
MEQISLIDERKDQINFRENVNKTQILQPTGEAGFKCEECNELFTDSLGYLDHINGFKHQRKLGINIHINRATLKDVQERLLLLKKRKEVVEKEFNFDEHMKQIRKREEDERAKRRLLKKQRKLEREEVEVEEDNEFLMGHLGFSSFGKSKKK